MKLLLVSQQQIATGKASCALGTLEGLFLCVGTLVTFQMLQSGKRALTSRAHMGAGFIGLGRREIGRCLRVDSNGRSY